MSGPSFGRVGDAPASLHIVGARLLDPVSGTDAVGDLSIHAGVIVAEPAPDAERIDGRDLLLVPGFCDLHAHLREPGGGGSETIESGGRAAERGGDMTICAMPNTEPPLDTPDAIVGATRDAACRVRVVGAATRGRDGIEVGDLRAMAEAGAVGFSDDGASVPSPDTVRAIFDALAGIGRPLVEHAEDPALAGEGVMRAGSTATRLGLAGWPAEAEVSIVRRDLALAEATGARLHLTHLSTAASVEAVREAKGRGVAVTCDVTPHHLVLTDAWVAGSRRFAWDEPEPDEALAYDGACRVNPPLASRDDALALMAAVADGTIDAIATDHAPHPPERTLVPFDEAAPGLTGLDTALSLGLAAVRAGRLPLATLIAALSSRPAAVIGETRGLAVGAAADVVLVDPESSWRVSAEAIASASANTPLLGMELPGIVRLTVAAGRVTYRS